MQGSAFHLWGRVFCFALALGPLVAPFATEGQPPGKVYRIGYLGATPREFQPPAHQWEALLDGLGERGYHEGWNFVFERRFSEGHAKRFPELAAELVRLRVDLILVTTEPAAFARTAQARPEALLVLSDALLGIHRPQIAEFATQQHLPSMFAHREWVVAGGLMSYGASFSDLFRRAATYVDKILKGAKPPTCPWNSPRRSSWSSTSRPPTPSASRFRRHFSSRRPR
jgi:hypothetical protein